MKKFFQGELALNLAMTLARFPMVIFSSLGLALLSLLANHSPHSSESYLIYLKLSLTLSLGLSSFLAAHLLTEGKHLKIKIIVHAIILTGLTLYYLGLPQQQLRTEGYASTWVFYSVLNLSLHLLVASIPYFRKNTTNVFWNFNKTLFLRFLLAALFSAILFGGLALALGSIDLLFKIHFRGKTYGDLFIVISFIFNTIFFLAGIPQNLSELESQSYPKSLRILCKYILAPLLVVYALILYVYGALILISGDWPHGMVAWLISFYSTVGVLCCLLLAPLKITERWSQKFEKIFYTMLLPLLALLGDAVWQRISRYGMTEERYYLVLLALWLTCLSLYFIFSRKKHIHWIPISLSAILILSLFGPWSSFAVSQRSQWQRLESILTKHQLLQNGKLTHTQKEVPNEDYQQASSIIGYLIKHYGLESFESLLGENPQFKEMKQQPQSWYHYETGITQLLIPKTSSDFQDTAPIIPNRYYFRVKAKHFDWIDTKGYDWMTSFSGFDQTLKSVKISLDVKTLVLNFSEAENRLASIDLKSFFPNSNFSKNASKDLSVIIPTEKSFQEIETDKIKVKFILDELIFYSETDQNFGLSNLKGTLLMRLK